MSNFERAYYNICAIAVAVLLSLLLVVFISFENESQNEEVSRSEIAYEGTVNLWTGSMGKIRMVEGWAMEETAEGWLLEDREGNQWIVEGLSTAVEQEEWVLLWIADMHTTDSVNDDVVIKVWMSASTPFVCFRGSRFSTLKR